MPADVPTAIGRYQILRSLGEGGMGSVYLARDPAIDRLVAIKLMRTGFDDGSLRERFAREAKSIGRLHHPNIVTIFDIGEHLGDPFIAMEYVEGQTLSHLVRHAAGSLLDRLGWMDGVCAGLQYAHKAGIVHRDIKPANIMIDTEGAVKILDFGIARAATGSMTHTATQAGTVLGTLNYMSPEQLSGRPVDHRTDIFSAGAVFYELLAGRMAFPGDIQSGVLHFILSAGPVEPLSAVNPSLDTALVAVVDRCLERDLSRRYSDLGLARRDLAVVRNRLEAGAGASLPTVVITPESAPEVRPGRTPGRETRAELLRLRKERIDQQLTEARAALTREEFAAALEGCRQALIIDPEHSGALELQEEIEAAQQAKDWLHQAQSELDKGALTSAALLADRVLGVMPGSTGALAIRRGIEEARRRLEAIERRARALAAALSEGRAHVEAGRLDEAARSVAAAEAIDPGNPDIAALSAAVAEARRLRAEAEARRRAEEEARRRAEEEARRRAEAEERSRQIIARAQQTIAGARRRFAAGDHEGALTMLRAHHPPHVLVEEEIGTLEREMREIARREAEARKAEEARRAEEARKAEEARRAEEARKAEEARQAELARKAEEARRAEETRRAEAARKAEEARRAEEARKAEAARKAEEVRRAEEARKTEAARKAEEARRADEARKAEDARRAQEARLAEEARRAEAKRREQEERQEREAAKRAAAEAEAERRQARVAAQQAAEEAARLQADREAGETQALTDRTLDLPETVRLPALGAGQARDVADETVIYAPGADTLVTSTPARSQTRFIVAGVIVALVTLALATGWWVSRKPAVPAAAAPVSVLIDVRPWANLEQVVRKSDGQSLNLGTLTTPCVVLLAPGEYHVRAKNPYFDAPLEFDLTVGTDAFQEVRQSLPDLKPDVEARKLLGGR